MSYILHFYRQVNFGQSPKIEEDYVYKKTHEDSNHVTTEVYWLLE